MQLYTLVLIAVTVLVSFAAFKDYRLTDRLILWPRRMNTPAEYHRFLSSGFIHNDGNHLLFNMFTLFFIGSSVERIFDNRGYHMLYPVMYFLGIIVSSLPSYLKNRDNPYYRSLGASGGVAAVLFSLVYFAPWARIYVFFLPVPNIVFAVLYLAYSVYMSKRGGDNVNHDAHFWGSVFGFLFTLAVDPEHGRVFIDQVQRPAF